MVLVSPTTMSPVVKRITGCGPLSQVSQLSQLEITLPMIAPFGMPKYMSKCHKCHKCHNYSIAFNLSSEKLYFIASCKVSASFRPVRVNPKILREISVQFCGS